ncbi:hypothetical protein X975_08885, partial [Stegodyphus mimosarum]
MSHVILLQQYLQLFIQYHWLNPLQKSHKNDGIFTSQFVSLLNYFVCVFRYVYTSR